MTEEKREDLATRGSYSSGLGREDLPPQTQAALWGREVSMPKCRGTAQPHSDVLLRAFLQLELHRVETAIGFYESKTAIIREAICAYLRPALKCVSPICTGTSWESD